MGKRRVDWVFQQGKQNMFYTTEAPDMKAGNRVWKENHARWAPLAPGSGHIPIEWINNQQIRPSQALAEGSLNATKRLNPYLHS